MEGISCKSDAFLNIMSCVVQLLLIILENMPVVDGLKITRTGWCVEGLESII